MKNQKEKQIMEGNSFYEIDLECVRRKEEAEKGTASSSNPQPGPFL